MPNPATGNGGGVWFFSCLLEAIVRRSGDTIQRGAHRRPWSSLAGHDRQQPLASMQEPCALGSGNRQGSMAQECG